VNRTNNSAWDLPGKIIRKILMAVVQLYRLLLSPFFGNNCRFYPSCSAYALEVLSKKPVYKALPLIFKRIIKCHPYHAGGYDPVK
jgi:putative membrane protein insertion efficiency factor